MEDLQLPRLSRAERDHRWQRVRAAMRDAGIDCLVVPYNTGHWSMFQGDVRYLTHLGGYESEVSAVFPLEGEVTAWVSSASYAPFCRAAQDWVEDVRNSGRRWSAVMVDRIRELGLEAGHVGVVGLDGLVHAPEGIVDHALVRALQEKLPRARLSSATALLQRVRYVKSEEELGAMARATRIAERAYEAMAAAAKPGVPDSQVYAEAYAAMLRHGGEVPTLILWRAAPEIDAHFHYPTDRPLQRGDLISSEIEGKYLGYSAQLVQPVAVEHLKPPYGDMLDRSIEAFNRLCPIMKPGTPFADLVALCDEMSRESEYSVRVAVQSRGMGDDWPLVLGAVGPEQADLRLEEHAVFVLKPVCAARDPERRINWGDMVVVKPEGAVRLGQRPQAIAGAGG